MSGNTRYMGQSLIDNIGPKHQRFQKILKDYLRVDNVELMANGHMVLELTLQAMNLQGEVITIPSVYGSCYRQKWGRPVFCDVDLAHTQWM